MIDVLSHGRVLVVALAVAVGLASPVAGREPASSPATLVRAWQALLDADTDAAFERIVADYRAAKDETLRGLLVSTVCSSVQSVASRARLVAWRTAHATPRDVWLWYRSLVAEYEWAPAAVRAAVGLEAHPFLRAAAVRALASWADPESLEEAPFAVRNQWGEGPRGAVLVEAWAAVVGSQPARSPTRAFREAVLAIAEYVEAQAPGERSALAIGRSLARAFAAPVSSDPLVWRSLLERVESAGDRPQGAHTAAPTVSFFDLDATGNRVVYVLDASSSMDDPIDRATADALRRLARTRSPTGDAGDAVWGKVKTARHAVMEVTKASLRTLRPTMAFAVVLFGDDARFLGSSTGLLPATSSNVEFACRALDAARRASPRGTTNLHAGLRLAFDAVDTPGGVKGTDGDDALATLAAGATTIFVLSDGAPSRDDWDDTANTATNRPWFADLDAILEDVRRRNLLRGVELHAIALGEDAPRVLAPLARQGGGRLRAVTPGAVVVSTSTDDVCPIPPGPFRTKVEGLLARLTSDAGPAAREQLFALLPDAPSPRDRAWLARHLARVGDRRVVPILLAAVDDPDDDTAGHAVAGLEALAQRSFGSPLGLVKAERAALRRNWTWWSER